MRHTLFYIMLTISLMIAACDDLFDYSPYVSDVKDSYLNIHHKHRKRIKEINSISDEFSFAIIADSHYRYHELKGAIDQINQNSRINFVIANGDITNNGYLKEYELFHDQMEYLKVPYLTVIGNHDYLTNGEDIYDKMYGETNYSFSVNECLFILFDNIIWESNQNPDYKWLESILSESEEYDKVFVISHQPPYTSQFNQNNERIYRQLMCKYQVDLSIHGHTHSYDYNEYYNDSVNYLVTGGIVNEEFNVITVSKDQIKIERIKY